MAAKHKNTVYKPPNVPNPFQEGQDKAYGDILFDKMQETKKWRSTTYVHLACLILSLIFFLIAISRQDIVPVLVNVMPSGEAQYIGEVRQSNSLFHVPESAIHYQIRSFITKLRTVSTDYMVVYNNIDDCFIMSAQSYVPILRDSLRADSPFDLVGEIRRTVDIESVLLVTGRSYQVNWTENTYDSSSSLKSAKYRAVVTVILASPTPQTIVRNPMGIYIENLEMTGL